MSRNLMARMDRVESSLYAEQMVLLTPHYWNLEDADAMDKLRDWARIVASNPRGMIVQRPSEDIPDPLTFLLGDAEAARLSAKHKTVVMRRSYGAR